MKKRNILLVSFLVTINTTFSQTNNSNSQPEKSPQSEVQSHKPMKVKKSTVTDKTVRVDSYKLEKKKAVVIPKEEGIIEEMEVEGEGRGEKAADPGKRQATPRRTTPSEVQHHEAQVSSSGHCVQRPYAPEAWRRPAARIGRRKRERA